MVATQSCERVEGPSADHPPRPLEPADHVGDIGRSNHRPCSEHFLEGNLAAVGRYLDPEVPHGPTIRPDDDTFRSRVTPCGWTQRRRPNPMRGCTAPNRSSRIRPPFPDCKLRIPAVTIPEIASMANNWQSTVVATHLRSNPAASSQYKLGQKSGNAQCSHSDDWLAGHRNASHVSKSLSLIPPSPADVIK